MIFKINRNTRQQHTGHAVRNFFRPPKAVSSRLKTKVRNSEPESYGKRTEKSEKVQGNL